MKSNAFTLIELLIYTVLFSLFALAAFGFCTITYSFLRKSSGQSTWIIKNALALDMIRKDLMSASRRPDVWDEKKCVFCKEQLDKHGKIVARHIGWESILDKNKHMMVRRSQGIYSFARHRWIKRSVSDFACQIVALRIQVVQSVDRSGIVRVQMIYGIDGKEAHETVTLRNRVIG